jgi:Zn-dependent metalloprotease
MKAVARIMGWSAKGYLPVCLLFFAILATSTWGDSYPDPLINELRKSSKSNIHIGYHSGTGKVRFLRTGPGTTIPQPFAIPRDAAPELAARSFLNKYGHLFGITDSLKELRVMRERIVDRGRSFVKFQQMDEGIPVIGAELIVQMDSKKNVLSANGEISSAPAVRTTPVFSPKAAEQKALEVVGFLYQIDIDRLAVSEPALWIYNPVLLGRGPNANTLVWRMEVKATEISPMREMVLIDAASGDVVLHFNQIDSVLNRRTYDHDNMAGKPLPGDPADLKRSEGQGPSGITDVDLAYDYAGDTYNFYSNYHGRDSIDNAGMELISTTRFCPDPSYCPFQNAFWEGTQMVYGEGFASADDVVAHEMTHGVTEQESNLMYYMQSGAINESFSDIWGEFVDLTNGKGNDALSVRWLMGEDLPIGAVRDMSNPTAFAAPDRMWSPNYWCHLCDNGGVHINSGIGNKAAYLITDGGTFNGKTISGLGITKVAKIFYEAQTNLLTSASDYNDLGDALQQACINLIGADGITASDCQEVANAIGATEMNQTPPANVLHNPGFEEGKVIWKEHSSGGYDIIVKMPFAFCYSKWFAILAGYDNAREYIYQDVAIPHGALQANLRFAYWISTHELNSEAYDTMKVEVVRPSDNAVLETLETLSNVNKSSGYWDLSAKYDLSSYEGQTIRLRFHATTNDSHLTLFLVDDVALALVTTPETISPPNTPNGPTSGVILTSYPFTTGGSSSSFGDPVRYRFDWGDGTTSGWLPVGVTSASKSWKNPGTYLVKAEARCRTHTTIVSSWSQCFSINIVPIQISLQSPVGSSVFDSSYLISGSQPQFRWTANGPLKKYTILISTSPTDFATIGMIIKKASVLGTCNAWKPSFFVWKNILRASYNFGATRDVYWKIIGTRPDGTFTETEVRNFKIGATQSVTIHTPMEGEVLFSSMVPTIGFDSNWNIKFTLEFSTLNDFSDPEKIRRVTFSITNSNSLPTVQKTLSSLQWAGITKLLGTGGHFRIKACDGLNRWTVSDVRAFSIQ